MNTALEQIVIKRTRSTLDDLAENANVAIEPSAVRTATAAVVESIGPVIAHATNAEPWYQSRVILGSVATIISSGFGIYALFSADVRDGELYAPLVTAAVGAAVALYGRMIAKKPLGT